MLRTTVCSYPIDVFQLSFNFLCLLLLYSIYLNARNDENKLNVQLHPACKLKLVRPILSCSEPIRKGERKLKEGQVDISALNGMGGDCVDFLRINPTPRIRYSHYSRDDISNFCPLAIQAESTLITKDIRGISLVYRALWSLLFEHIRWSTLKCQCSQYRLEIKKY